MNATIVYLILSLWNGGQPGDGVHTWFRTVDTMLQCQELKSIEIERMLETYPDLPWYAECHQMVHTFLPPRISTRLPDVII